MNNIVYLILNVNLIPLESWVVTYQAEESSARKIFEELDNDYANLLILCRVEMSITVDQLTSDKAKEFERLQHQLITKVDLLGHRI